MRTFKKLVIHCTDSDDSLDIGFREINNWHKQNGWLDKSGISCGYHYIVRRNGSIERGRDVHTVGAHAMGYNSESIGIVWVGRNKPTKTQMKAVYDLCRSLMDQYSIDITDVLGHYELNNKKTCPNLDMNLFRGEVAFTKKKD